MKTGLAEFSKEKHRVAKQIALHVGCNVMYDDYTYQLTGIDIGTGCSLFSWTSDSEFHHIDVSKIKLILRPLADIKREESVDIARLLYLDIDEKHDEETFFIIEKAMRGEIKGITWMRDLKGCFEITQYLISKGFDVFGMISSGTAIDLTKMEVKPII